MMAHVTFWPRFIDRAHLGRLKRSSQCKIGLIKDYYYGVVADPCSRSSGFANPHRHCKNGPDVGGRSVEWQEMRGARGKHRSAAGYYVDSSEVHDHVRLEGAGEEFVEGVVLVEVEGGQRGAILVKLQREMLVY